MSLPPNESSLRGQIAALTRWAYVTPEDRAA
jgi:hypothetical protein